MSSLMPDTTSKTPDQSQLIADMTTQLEAEQGSVTATWNILASRISLFFESLFYSPKEATQETAEKSAQTPKTFSENKIDELCRRVTILGLPKNKNVTNLSTQLYSFLSKAQPGAEDLLELFAVASLYVEQEEARAFAAKKQELMQFFNVCASKNLDNDFLLPILLQINYAGTLEDLENLKQSIFTNTSIPDEEANEGGEGSLSASMQGTFYGEGDVSGEVSPEDVSQGSKAQSETMEDDAEMRFAREKSNLIGLIKEIAAAHSQFDKESAFKRIEQANTPEDLVLIPRQIFKEAAELKKSSTFETPNASFEEDMVRSRTLLDGEYEAPREVVHKTETKQPAEVKGSDLWDLGSALNFALEKEHKEKVKETIEKCLETFNLQDTGDLERNKKAIISYLDPLTKLNDDYKDKAATLLYTAVFRSLEFPNKL